MAIVITQTSTWAYRPDKKDYEHQEICNDLNLIGWAWIGKPMHNGYLGQRKWDMENNVIWEYDGSDWIVVERFVVG